VAQDDAATASGFRLLRTTRSGNEPLQQLSYFDLVGFGPNGWGWALLLATGMTLAVASCGFLVGAVIGTIVAWAKVSRSFVARSVADGYTTILRGVPDLLVIYLFYFGGSAALGAIAGLFGHEGFIGVPAFVTGALAIGVVSGAYQAEVFRGAYQALSRGELEAARSVGMHSWLMFRRIIAPQVLRYAIPGLGNVWQLVLKESALISVTGLVELLRQSHIAAGSTRRPFDFYLTAAALYLVITWVSTVLFQRAEAHSMRGVRRAA
jgi:octopine/nopaline transport system permease protein